MEVAKVKEFDMSEFSPSRLPKVKTDLYLKRQNVDILTVTILQPA
jgi:hypothetical protein